MTKKYYLQKICQEKSSLKFSQTININQKKEIYIPLTSLMKYDTISVCSRRLNYGQNQQRNNNSYVISSLWLIRTTSSS